MSWENLLKDNKPIKEALNELMALNTDASQKYAELSNRIIPPENKPMLDAELSDIATGLLDLQKAYSRLAWALDRQETLR
tara:strand:- start:35 stop:274 length:240 start_codon:yes stop_codon:yes gene_type:complete